MFVNPSVNRQRQKFICFYWLISMLNFVWNIISLYIHIDSDGYSIWKICSTCHWQSSEFLFDKHQLSSYDKDFHNQIIISNHSDDDHDWPLLRSSFLATCLLIAFGRNYPTESLTFLAFTNLVSVCLSVRVYVLNQSMIAFGWCWNKFNFI